MKSSKPAPELDFSQISLISCVREPESWTWRLKSRSTVWWWSDVLRIVVCSWPRIAIALSLTPAMSNVKEKKPRAPAYVSTADAEEAKKNFLRLLKGEGDHPGFFSRVNCGEEVCEGEGDGPEDVSAACCKTKGCLKTTLGWVVSWWARQNPLGGGLDQTVDLCGNWVTCPSRDPLNCN